MQAFGYPRRCHAAVIIGIISAAVGAALAYPFLPAVGRATTFVAFSWLVIIPVAIGTRRAPRALLVAWRLLLLAMIASAVAHTVLWSVHSPSPPMRTFLVVEPVLQSVLILAATLAVIMVRGRNDFGGLLDAGLVAVVLGGVIGYAVVLPRAALAGRDTGATVALAVVVMVLAAALGALVRLIETDNHDNRALRLLLIALGLDLIGFVLAGGWPPGPVRAAAVVLHLFGDIALGLASIDTAMTQLADPGSPRTDHFGSVRMIFIAVALLAVPVMTGVHATLGHPINGPFVILASLLIVGLVLLRIALLTSQLRRSERSLRHLASHDPLTGVLNRRAFTEALAAALDSPHDFLLIFCDLDHFKHVNDAHGHATGDRLLIEVAARLRRCVRAHDAVGRLGGDEFLILFRDATPNEIDALRKRIDTVLSSPFTALGATISVTASIGLVPSYAGSRRDVTAQDLIAYADSAMYAAKGSDHAPNDGCRQRLTLLDPHRRGHDRTERHNTLR